MTAPQDPSHDDSLLQALSDKGKALIAGILAGLAAPATIGAPVEYPRPKGDDLSRLRGDVLRLGGTFRAVIEQEQQVQRQVTPPS